MPSICLPIGPATERLETIVEVSIRMQCSNYSTSWMILLVQLDCYDNLRDIARTSDR